MPESGLAVKLVFLRPIGAGIEQGISREFQFPVTEFCKPDGGPGLSGGLLMEVAD